MRLTMTSIHELAKHFDDLFQSARRIVICSHMNPDGDNLGSIMAMYHMAKNHGKDAYVICNDEIPTEEKFLPGLEAVVRSEDFENMDIDLMIVLDCSDLNRIGSCKDLFFKAEKTINIDHHNTNTGFADLNIVDFSSPATCETLFEVFEALDYPMDQEIATCLYCGISTDTGSFKYDSVRSRTFEIAAKLMDCGISLNEISVHLYQSRTKEKTALLLKALDSLEYFANDQIGVVIVREQDILETKARKSDAEGIVEFIRDIKEVELALLLKEKDDFVRLSARSKSFIDCTKIASQFNGGGHIRASGGTIYGMTIEEAKQKVVQAALKEFNE